MRSRVGTAHIMIMTRFPELGRVKTRLISGIGAQSATQLMTEMGAHVGFMVRYACHLSLKGNGATSALDEVTAEGCVAGPLGAAAKWLGMPCTAQVEGSLGTRIQAACRGAFDRGAEVAAVVGGDCPELTPILINRALVAARVNHGAALITATDGGYCMLALHRDAKPHLETIFQDIEWSTEKVSAQQCKRIESAGFECAHIAQISDVDRPEDIALWERIYAAWYGPITQATIIVPTLNEEALLEKNIPAMREYITASLMEQLDASTKATGVNSHVSVVVSDGGSTDLTLDIAKRVSAKVVTGYKGRASQMNAGAHAALVALTRPDANDMCVAESPVRSLAEKEVEALVFFHADTLPQKKRSSMSRSGALDSGSENPFVHLSVNGADVVSLTFGFKPEPMKPTEKISLAVFEFFTRLRPRFGGLPYGDQGFICRRAYFDGWGGFPSMEILEDFEFARRAAATGRLKISGDLALTSSRRYRANGPFALMRLHRKIIKSYLRGGSTYELAKMRAATRSGR